MLRRATMFVVGVVAMTISAVATMPSAGATYPQSDDLASTAVSAVRVEGTAWVTARVHPRGTVTRDGLAEVKVTYRCQLPGDTTGSTEGYRVLAQHPGTPREVSDDGYDVDEFGCDGSRFTVPHAFSSETGRFHRGWARLTLDVRACTGDVTDEPGTCFSTTAKARVLLRRVG